MLFHGPFIGTVGTVVQATANKLGDNFSEVDVVEKQHPARSKEPAYLTTALRDLSNNTASEALARLRALLSNDTSLSNDTVFRFTSTVR